jgi:biopolymer transport protein ExbB
MIVAFSAIAVQDGIGKPELLSNGISQALVTTAAGLAVAIPTQAAYYYFKSRIDRFARLAEDVHAELHGALDAKVAA